MGTLIMKIAGITWHGVDNFGSMLQAYALQKTIEKIGVKHTYISYTKKANVKYVVVLLLSIFAKHDSVVDGAKRFV